MPARAKRYCARCRRVHAGKCPQAQNRWESWQRQKGSDTRRGYGAPWRKLRQPVIRRDKGLCQLCLLKGLAVAGTHVDHIKPKSQGGTDDMDNLQLLCKPCHLTKTAQEGGGARGRGGSNPHSPSSPTPPP
ncbi:HNH endonuclease [uncultured Microbulbifer sp.]|uniref:HNH endonuclease n=1 Tax=uncultured Microbulbifer sp. TaxID=348147 RepID=UPI0026079555|nr:HNH endonuclease [uncultured Microbulbifer sp.]